MFKVETLDESIGHCDCCGHDTHSIWGLVHSGPTTVAAYWVRWTDGHLRDAGASLDLVIGSWGDGTSTKDRIAISLWHRELEDGSPSLMVVDAEPRPSVADSALRRDEVIGTPLATRIFAITDAIYLQDGRFF